MQGSDDVLVLAHCRAPFSLLALSCTSNLFRSLCTSFVCQNFQQLLLAAAKSCAAASTCYGSINETTRCFNALRWPPAKHRTVRHCWHSSSCTRHHAEAAVHPVHPSRLHSLPGEGRCSPNMAAASSSCTQWIQHAVLVHSTHSLYTAQQVTGSSASCYQYMLLISHSINAIDPAPHCHWLACQS
jgi:hypothetical protein